MPTVLAPRDMLATTSAGLRQDEARSRRKPTRHLRALIVAAGLGLGLTGSAASNECFAQEQRRSAQVVAAAGEAKSTQAAVDVPFLTPKREVPQSSAPHPADKAWDTATVICIALLAGLVLGAAAAVGLREGRLYFQRDSRATQRLRERDHEARQQLDDRRDASVR